MPAQRRPIDDRGGLRLEGVAGKKAPFFRRFHALVSAAGHPGVAEMEGEEKGDETGIGIP